MNNPQMRSMAENMMNNPQMRSMAENMAANMGNNNTQNPPNNN
jgi:hypothetical protein